MALILKVWLNGPEMSQEALDGLRARLNLKARGRLDDSEDIRFGSRYLREDDDDGMLILELKREYDGDYAGGWDDDWCLTLGAARGALVDEETVRQVRSDIEEAARALGFTPSMERERRAEW